MKEDINHVYLYIMNENNFAKIREYAKDLLEVNPRYFYHIIKALALKEERNQRIDNMYDYGYTFNYYEHILIEFKRLVKKLNLDSSLSVAYLGTYMMLRGYFSKNKRNTYQDSKRILLDGLSSYNLFSGIGVCQDYSSLLKDLLNTCGYNACNLCCSLNSRFLNHMVTYIYDEKEDYIYDPTNILIFNLVDYDLAINNNYRLKIYPFYSYLFNLRKDDILALNKYLLKNHFKKARENKIEFIKVYKTILSNEELLAQFYQNISSYVISLDGLISDIRELKKIH